MKKIIFLLDHLEYSNGVTRVLIEACNNLDHDKFDITIMPLYRLNKELAKELDPKIKLKKAFGFYFRGFSKIANMLPLSVLYKKFIGFKYDIEIAFQCNLSTRIVAGSLNPKAVHAAWMHCYENYPLEYRKLDKVVGVSKYVADKCEKENNKKVNVTYCYNILDDRKVVKMAKENVPIPKKTPRFITVGRLSPEKGFVRLVNIFGELKREGYDFSLQIIGKGSEMNKLKKAIDDNNLKNNVKLLGEQKNPHKFTSKSDVFICSSFDEGYSTACTEAAILGIPVITTCVPGGSELIDTCECGILTEFNDKSLKAGIEQVLKNPGLIQDWKEKIKTTNYKFSKDYRKEKLNNLFDEFYNLSEQKKGGI